MVWACEKGRGGVLGEVGEVGVVRVEGRQPAGKT